MKYVENKMDLFVFVKLGEDKEALENLFKNIKIRIAQQFFNEENEWYKNYIIEFKKKYWDDFKIQKMVDNTVEICSGFYRFYGSKYLCREEVVDKVKALKPFDVLLVAKTREEYEIEQKQNEIIESCTGKDANGLSDEERNKLLEEVFKIHPMYKYSFLFINKSTRDEQ